MPVAPQPRIIAAAAHAFFQSISIYHDARGSVPGRKCRGCALATGAALSAMPTMRHSSSKRDIIRIDR